MKSIPSSEGNYHDLGFWLPGFVSHHSGYDLLKLSLPMRMRSFILVSFCDSRREAFKEIPNITEFEIKSQIWQH